MKGGTMEGRQYEQDESVETKGAWGEEREGIQMERVTGLKKIKDEGNKREIRGKRK